MGKKGVVICRPPSTPAGKAELGSQVTGLPSCVPDTMELLVSASDFSIAAALREKSLKPFHLRTPFPGLPPGDVKGQRFQTRELPRALRHCHCLGLKRTRIPHPDVTPTGAVHKQRSDHKLRTAILGMRYCERPFRRGEAASAVAEKAPAHRAREAVHYGRRALLPLPRIWRRRSQGAGSWGTGRLQCAARAR